MLSWLAQSFDILPSLGTGNGGLVDSLLGLEPGVPRSIPSLGTNFVFRNTLISIES